MDDVKVTLQRVYQNNFRFSFIFVSNRTELFCLYELLA